MSTSPREEINRWSLYLPNSPIYCSFALAESSMRAVLFIFESSGHMYSTILDMARLEWAIIIGDLSFFINSSAIKPTILDFLCRVGQ
ncbi:unnamed protein product [Meloidogyne enterolobii]|uniref:Uncharacterized protein n=1 Tax=Meloidogyne enterolobii TaxID=390850 RepID=A0ACB0ZFU8_MELEN